MVESLEKDIRNKHIKVCTNLSYPYIEVHFTCSNNRMATHLQTAQEQSHPIFVHEPFTVCCSLICNTPKGRINQPMLQLSLSYPSILWSVLNYYWQCVIKYVVVFMSAFKGSLICALEAELFKQMHTVETDLLLSQGSCVATVRLSRCLLSEIFFCVRDNSQGFTLNQCVLFISSIRATVICFPNRITKLTKVHTYNSTQQ